MSGYSDPAQAGVGEISIADRAWAALRAHGIPPTPRSFEVFYTLFASTNPTLTDRVRTLEAGGVQLTPGQIETLHQECVERVDIPDAVEAGAEQIADVAQAVVDQIVGNGAALRRYGSLLDQFGGHLNAQSSVKDLLVVITALSTLTAEASARNRALEAKLSTSVAQIAHLREDLNSGASGGDDGRADRPR